ncbi:Diaminobutyrate--2-oxoglutarate aminotransferase [Burkholderia multivorans]
MNEFRFEVPAATDMFEFVQQRESSARTYASSLGRVFVKGRRSHVVDSDDNEYLDCLSCAGTLALGHNHPYVRDQVIAFLQSDQLLQALDITTPAKSRFIAALFDALPAAFAGHARIQFCGPSGADATEAVVKLMKTATGRRSILAFHGGYHGMTAGALSLTGNLTAKSAVASLMPDVHFLPYPYAYRCPFGTDGSATADLSLAYIERLLSDPESGIVAPAAIVVEAVQGEGGVIPAPASWLRGVRELTARFDIPLVIDEIQTGFGRTGTMFAFEHAGIVPDAVLISKAIGGGFPLSLVLYHERYDQWKPGAHAGTFRGNQIAMAAGTAFLEVMANENMLTAVRERGEQLEGGLRALERQYPNIGDVRGRGLMWGLEIVNPDAPADRSGRFPADGDTTRRLKRACLERGLIVESGGRFGAVLRMLPPLTITAPEIDELLTKLAAACSDIWPGSRQADVDGGALRMLAETE